MALQGATGKEYCPGDSMDALSTLALAAEYAQASKALRKLGRMRQAQSYAPFRFAALHAIELYLSAYLRLHGLDNAELRSTGHRFCAKTELATQHGLRLRKKTHAHLIELSGNREYQAVRYDTTMLALLTKINRLEATRDEIAAEVTRIVEAKCGAAGAT
jgi:hypothetical protein